MRNVTVSIQSNYGCRASEIVADLRNVAETLFHPMSLVGFWDHQAGGMHLCPHENRKEECPHKRLQNQLDSVDYRQTIEIELGSDLEVYFPHAEVYIYLK